MGSSDDIQVNHRLEYELIHKARISFSDAMIRWRQITLPLSAAIFSFFAGLRIDYWWVGWIVSMLLLIDWRYTERHIDQQIVGFYPRILQLEKELGMTFYSDYIFNNLNKNLCEAKRLQKYLPDGSFNHKELIELAKSHPRNFIGPRGHDILNRSVYVYFILGILACAIYFPIHYLC